MYVNCTENGWHRFVNSGSEFLTYLVRVSTHHPCLLERQHVSVFDLYPLLDEYVHLHSHQTRDELQFDILI